MINYINKIRNGIPKTFIAFFICLIACQLNAQPEIEDAWTDNQYPDYIKRLSQWGERPDWSHDGKILFVARTFVDVYELEIATGIIRPITHNYYHRGYSRVLYLSNGDILLHGPKYFSSDNWKEARFKKTELWMGT